MEYNILACDGPDCDKRIDLKLPQLPAHLTESPDESSSVWITVKKGNAISYFCSDPCLVAFVNSKGNEHADRMQKQYKNIVGKDWPHPQ